MAVLDFATITDLIRTNHPAIFPLLNKPGIWDLAARIIQAETDGTPMTDPQITAALDATPYYQSTPVAQRQWDIILATDPATAKFKGDAMTQRVLSIASGLGMKLTPDQQWLFVGAALDGNWDATQVKYNLLAGLKGYGLPLQPGGTVGATATQLAKDAQDYAVPLSHQTIMDWAMQIEQGTAQKSGFDDYLLGQAKSLYSAPDIQSALDRGVTIKQYADPYIQIAQRELGVNPSSVDLTDPKWNAALNQVDPKTGIRSVMSLSDWTSRVRTDASYGYDNTTSAQTQAAAFAKNLSQQFGAT